MTAPTTPIRTGLRPTRAEVDLAAVRANVARIRARTGTDVCAVVKADGYGHGAVPIARAAQEGGASWLAVALVEEGVALRDAGVTGPILLLSEPPVAAIPDLLACDLTPSVYREPFLTALDAAAHERGRPVGVHVNVDTGMHRVGIPPADLVARFGSLASAPGLVVEGIYTHLARADEPQVATTSVQLDAYRDALRTADGMGLAPTLRHAANTAGALLHPAARFDLVRPGIGIYGLSPAADVDAADHGLVPALRLVSEVSFAKRIPAGAEVSYGHRWRAPADGWLATVPIGYADGVPRKLTGRGEVVLGGRRRPIAGTVTMDQLMVWCGDDEPRVGDEVVLLGRQDDAEVRVEEWAELTGTITYEIVCQLTARVPRHHLG